MSNPLDRGIGLGNDIVPVTPNDDADLATAGRAIRCKGNGTAGTLKIKTNAGAERTTYILPGEILPVAVMKVFATGTTATGLEVIV